jgi:hypothetical protein
VNPVDVSALRRISGFQGGWLVDSETGFVMSGEGTAPDHDAARDAAVDIARSTLKALGTARREDWLDDIQISLGRSIYLVRPLRASPKVCLCVVLDQEMANPGLARVQLRRVEQSLRA